jgi:hypothetical protein
MPLALEADNMHIVKWWVDASFAVHPDMKSHTGGVMSLRKGAVYGSSTWQKLNTRSSTEAEETADGLWILPLLACRSKERFHLEKKFLSLTLHLNIHCCTVRLYPVFLVFSFFSIHFYHFLTHFMDCCMPAKYSSIMPYCTQLCAWIFSEAQLPKHKKLTMAK